MTHAWGQDALREDFGCVVRRPRMQRRRVTLTLISTVRRDMFGSTQTAQPPKGKVPAKYQETRQKQIHIINKKEERSNLPSYNIITTTRRKITVKEQIIGKKLNITKRKNNFFISWYINTNYSCHFIILAFAYA